MRLKNKKTGEIVEFRYLQLDHVAPLVLTTYENDKPEMYTYNSLAELNAEWCDAPEEPKMYWCVNGNAEIISMRTDWESPETTEACKQIGNYFSSREEAEKAVEKLRAWKRLKDKGFRVIDYGDEDIRYEIKDRYDGCLFDLETALFGGGE